MIRDYGGYVGLLAFIISAFTLLYHYFGWYVNSKKEQSDLEIRINNKIANELKECPLRMEIKEVSDKLDEHLLENETRLSRIETKMELFWGQVGDAVRAMIKQPIHFRKDELMDKLLGERTSTLTVEELFELKNILKEELPPLTEAKSEKCLAYALALAYIDQILYDKGCLN